MGIYISRALNARSVALMVLMILLVALAACGRRSVFSGSVQVAEPKAAPAVAAEEVQDSLQALHPPQGVDSGLYAILKGFFEQELERCGGGKLASTPPTGDENAIDDLAIASSTEETITLTWSYRNCGDYDQSGTVGIPDITPIAVYYDVDVAQVPEAEVADGNGDGFVTVSDITPVAMYFGVEVAGYRIKQALSEEGEYETVADIALPEPPEVGCITFEETIGLEDSPFFRVVPVDGEGAEGAASNVMYHGEIVEPQVLGVNPHSGTADLEVTFRATVAGAEPFEYDWCFSDGAVPGSSTEASPTVRMTSTGGHAASVTVTNVYGSDYYEFTLWVNPGIPPEILGVVPHAVKVGASTVITAIVTGLAPFEYSWQLPGLIEGDTSEMHSPEVLATEPGDYKCSVTVANGSGEETYDFILKAGMPADFPKVLSVRPDEFWGGVRIRLYPEVTGAEPLHYFWDFSEDACPAYSMRPVVSLGDGCMVTLVLSNDYGTHVFKFEASVLASSEQDWKLKSVDEIYGSHIKDISAAMIGGRMGVAYWIQGADLSRDIVKFSLATDELSFSHSAGAGEWIVDRNDDWSSAPHDIELCEVGGKPMIAYEIGRQGEDSKVLTVAVCENPEAGLSAEWNYYAVPAGGMIKDIAEVQGRPALLYGRRSGDPLVRYLYYAINTEPDASGVWQEVEVAQSEDSIGMASLGVFGGKPAVVYLYREDGARRLGYAYSEQDDGLGAWTRNDIVEFPSYPDTWERSHSLCEIEGLPVVATVWVGNYSHELRLYQPDAPDGSGIWSHWTVLFQDPYEGKVNLEMSLAVVNGSPAIACQSMYWPDPFCAERLWYYTTDSTDGFGDWREVGLVDPMRPSGNDPQLLELPDGRPAIIHNRDGPDHPEDWENTDELSLAYWKE